MQKKIFGLSTAEVESRISQNQQNIYAGTNSKSTLEIIGDHIFTLFNFLNFSIAFFLALVGAFSSLLFILLVILNIILGIFQELGARRQLDKLDYINKETVTVIRNGEEVRISSQEVVLDDILYLEADQRIPADAIIIDGTCIVNEAHLSGKSRLLNRGVHETLLGGSVLINGTCYAQVTHVGSDNYGNQLAKEAKLHTPIQSEFQRSIHVVSKIASFVIAPLGMALFLEGYLYRGASVQSSVIIAAASLLGFLPKGLVLLITIALITAIIRLAKKNILVQSMFSVEVFSYVDTVCLDKTGTLTKGRPVIKEVISLSDKPIDLILGSYLYYTEDDIVPMQAIRNYFKATPHYKISHTVPFTSARDWGGFYFETLGSVVFGPPESFLSKDQFPQEIDRVRKKGNRVVMLAFCEEPFIDDCLPENLTPLALIVLEDPLREHTKETLTLLQKEGIALKVISGDDVVITSAIAKKAGVIGYDQCIDLSQITSLSTIYDAATRYTVFGGVSPQQKKLLIQELKAQDQTVAMIGDGINDALALREADCSIAMADGDCSAHQIAHLTLLDSDFLSLPSLLFEGRRVINNVSRVSGIFFLTSFFYFILATFYLLTSIYFSFIPLHTVLIEVFIEGFPALILSFEESKEKVQRKFMPQILKKSLPFAFLFLGNLIFILFYGYHHDLSKMQYSTLIYYMLIGICLLSVIQSCLPLNPLRVFVVFTTFITLFFIVRFNHETLGISLLDARTQPIFLFLLIITAILSLFIYVVTHPRAPRE